jgi:hypothetical protein
MAQKEALLETVNREKDVVQGALVEYTSLFGDDVFTSDSYHNLIAAYQYAQEPGGIQQLFHGHASPVRRTLFTIKGPIFH